MSNMVMSKAVHELYVAVCKECPSLKALGAIPASYGMKTTYEAQNMARDHAKETGHRVVGTYRREEEWVTITGEPPEE